jgi:hypothetical protein
MTEGAEHENRKLRKDMKGEFFYVVHLLPVFLLEFIRLPEADPSTSSG